MSTAENNITLNQGSGGPVVATDFVNPSSGISAHVQYVKLDIGAENAHQPVTSSTPLPISVNALPSNWLSIPVGGGTGGQGITITGNIEAGIVGISHGTLDRIAEGVSSDIRSVKGITFALGATIEGFGKISEGVSIDIRSIPGSLTLDLGGGTVGQVGTIVKSPSTGITAIAGGITLAVTTTGSEKVAVTGVVGVSASLPTTGSMTSGTLTCDNVGNSLGFPSFEAVKRIEIRNLSQTVSGISLGFTYGAPVAIGKTAGGVGMNLNAGDLTSHYIIPAGESVVLEVEDLNEIQGQSITGGDGATQSIVTFVAS